MPISDLSTQIRGDAIRRRAIGRYASAFQIGFTRSERALRRPGAIPILSSKGIFMAEPSSELEGPDFEKGYKIDELADGEMRLGHAFGEAILAARKGREIFAIGATCTHYRGPLAK